MTYYEDYGHDRYTYSRNDRERELPRALDPDGCGCTECITGEYLPLERATAKQVYQCARGEIRDNCSVWHVSYDDDGMTVTNGLYSFNFPDEDLNSFPVNEIKFDNFSLTITLNSYSVEKYKDTLS